MFGKINTIDRKQTSLGEMASDIKTIKHDIQTNCRNIDDNSRALAQLTYSILMVKVNERAHNIIIHGYQERTGETYETLLPAVNKLLCEKLDIDNTLFQPISAERLGAARTNISSQGQRFCRPVRCTLKGRSDVDIIMSKCRLLRNTGISIDKDYPPEIVAKRRELWPLFKQLRNEHGFKNVQFKFPAMITVNGNAVANGFPYWTSANKPLMVPATQYSPSLGAQCSAPNSNSASRNVNMSTASHVQSQPTSSNLGSQAARSPKTRVVDQLQPSCNPSPQRSQMNNPSYSDMVRSPPRIQQQSAASDENSQTSPSLLQQNNHFQTPKNPAPKNSVKTQRVRSRSTSAVKPRVARGQSQPTNQRASRKDLHQCDAKNRTTKTQNDPVE